MLLQEDICIVQILLSFHCGADLGDLLWSNRGGLIAKTIAGKGEHGGNFVVFE